jgi:hypothetical protein
MATADPSSTTPPNYVPSPGRPHGHFQPLGDRWAALTGTQRIVIFVVALAAVILVVSVIAASRQPPPPSPDCPSPPCSPPVGTGGGNVGGGIVVEPAPDSTAPPLRLSGEWTNDALGVAVEFDPEDWTADAADRKERSVFLVTTSKHDYTLFIQVAPADEKTPDTLAADRLTYLKTLAPDLTEEPDPNRKALGLPTIGLRRATSSMLAGTYTGTLFKEPWTVVLMSAGDGQVSILVQLVSEDGARASAFRDADHVINAIRWP